MPGHFVLPAQQVHRSMAAGACHALALTAAALVLIAQKSIKKPRLVLTSSFLWKIAGRVLVENYRSTGEIS
ncbi:hypothetical protein [Comamonas sp. GB3 AK4-5]|uniref:hypothetical protein n=1 Tax=Comamonas sp. GB3 AK4-5 TaxID=3231487 RepID=UPI00351F7B8A